MNDLGDGQETAPLSVYAKGLAAAPSVACVTLLVLVAALSLRSSFLHLDGDPGTRLSYTHGYGRELFWAERSPQTQAVLLSIAITIALIVLGYFLSQCAIALSYDIEATLLPLLSLDDEGDFSPGPVLRILVLGPVLQHFLFIQCRNLCICEPRELMLAAAAIGITGLQIVHLGPDPQRRGQAK